MRGSAEEGSPTLQEADHNMPKERKKKKIIILSNALENYPG